LFGARTTNVLQKGTVYLAVLFFILTLTLAILVQKKNKISSLAKAPAIAEEAAAPEEKPKSLSEELPIEATPAPAEKPAEEKPAEEKPAEEKPAEEKPAEEKPVEPTAPEAPAEGDKAPTQ
jgi:preprotein translocase subunit SecG